MPRVNLPPGCMGFKASDGTRYMAKPGTHVNVEDRHMAALQSQDYVSAGLVAGAEKFIIDSRKAPEGRWCRPCIRSYHAWTKVCPKCGGVTVPESELVLPKMDRFVP